MMTNGVIFFRHGSVDKRSLPDPHIHDLVGDRQVTAMHAGSLHWMELRTSERTQRNAANRWPRGCCPDRCEISVGCFATNLDRVARTHPALAWTHGCRAITL